MRFATVSWQYFVWFCLEIQVIFFPPSMENVLWENQREGSLERLMAKLSILSLESFIP